VKAATLPLTKQQVNVLAWLPLSRRAFSNVCLWTDKGASYLL
jgi:hypothetical protein